MVTPLMYPEECYPGRILDNSGFHFIGGAITGSVYHLVKGSLDTHRGQRILGGFQRMRMNAPRTAGGFAAWGGLRSIFNYTLINIRHKEDPWNMIFASAAANGFVVIRTGIVPAFTSAIIGGTVMAMIEAADIMLTRNC